MAARLIVRERVVYPDGDIVEMVVWMLPEPVPPTTHGFKYRLVYVRGANASWATTTSAAKAIIAIFAAKNRRFGSFRSRACSKRSSRKSNR
jgi:hypothetical protein